MAEEVEAPLSKWFSETVSWFVLFVRTYEEKRVAVKLQSRLDAESYFVFVPTKDYAFRKKGKTEIRKVPWLSGYVFIASTVETSVLSEVVESLISNDTAIFKLLSNDGSRDAIALSLQDKALMMSILDSDFNISAVKAEIVDGKVRLKDNRLEEKGGKVKKVDKHKQTVLVELAMLGRKFSCEIALEF